MTRTEAALFCLISSLLWLLALTRLAKMSGTTVTMAHQSMGRRGSKAMPIIASSEVDPGITRLKLSARLSDASVTARSSSTRLD